MLLVSVVLAGLLALTMPAGAALDGPADGTLIGTDAARGVVFTFPEVPGASGDVRATLDGVPVAVRSDGELFAVTLTDLEEGPHRLSVTVPSWLPFVPATTTRDFTVDTRPPAVTVEPLQAASLDEPLTVRGTVEDVATLRVADRPVAVDDGAFALAFPSPPPAVSVRAADHAGNVTELRVPVAVEQPPLRAVHMSALAWSSDALREPVLRMVREGRINAVQLDIKDESGEVGYDSQVPLARRIGAAKGYYDARQAIDELHALGARVVGRLVAFRDPVLAQAAWQRGDRGMVVQTAAGQPWSGGYGGYAFTNFADREVRRYNIDLAAEAAALGFDHILYDYVRRPDGPVEAMRFPGLRGTPEASIASFLQATREEVRPRGALLGASVFGIAATRPTQIAQDIPAIQREVDYVAPMVYPSHWNAGEYGVADPEGQPYDITLRSVADFQTLAAEGTTKVVPWLQAFSLRRTYGPAEVRAQIDAATAAGTDSFILWNAACRYDPAALPAAGG